MTEEYQTMRVKQENETWQSYARRQMAYIRLLEIELDQYRQMLQEVRDVNKMTYRVLDFHEKYVKKQP